MIPIFKKLKQEGLLKQGGALLDLGCGNGEVSKPFFEHGYDATLVDINEAVLNQAAESFKNVKEDGFVTVNSAMEGFEFNEKYDGIIMSNVLPFQKDKENIKRMVQSAFDSLNEGGFLFFTLFGTQDAWAANPSAEMIFHTKEEAVGVLPESIYFLSEDYGKGLTMKRQIKMWHIFHLLYIK